MLYSDIVDVEHFHHWHGFTIKTTHLTCYKHQFQPFFLEKFYLYTYRCMFLQFSTALESILRFVLRAEEIQQVLWHDDSLDGKGRV